MEAYMGSIMLFAGNFAPRGWMFCAGQTLPIAQYQALFSLLGTFYGGNGTTNFMLPDLRSRVPVGTGQGQGLSNWVLGEQQGVENVTLTPNQMPAHNHTVQVGTSEANTPVASNNYLAVANSTLGGDPVVVNTYNGTPNATLAANSISVAGQSLPHSNIQPSLGLNYIICIDGLYPSRN